jgi:hypothetical protein
MSFISRKKLVIAGLIWGVSLAVFVPVYMFVLRKQFSDLDDKNVKLDSLMADVNEARFISLQESIDKFQSQVDEIKALFNRFVVPSKDYIQTLASIEIDKISKELGLESFYIDPWKGDEIAGFSECKYLFGQPMEVTFKATFTEFAKFLNMLERYKSVIFIDTFSIIRSKEKDAKHQIRMNLAVLVQKQSSAEDISG